MTTTDHAAALADALQRALEHSPLGFPKRRELYATLTAYEASIAPDPYALLRTATRETLALDSQWLAIWARNYPQGAECLRLERAAQLLRAILAITECRAEGSVYIPVRADAPLVGIANLAAITLNIP